MTVGICVHVFFYIDNVKMWSHCVVECSFSAHLEAVILGQKKDQIGLSMVDY